MLLKPGWIYFFYNEIARGGRRSGVCMRVWKSGDYIPIIPGTLQKNILQFEWVEKIK